MDANFAVEEHGFPGKAAYTLAMTVFGNPLLTMPQGGAVTAAVRSIPFARRS